MPVEPDPDQRAVVDLPDDASAVVLGAPGTGKTSTVVELVADRVLRRGWAPGEVLVLTVSRLAAARLRDRLALRLGVPTDGPLARTVLSLAFELATARARAERFSPPRLATGGEQDADIAALLAGHLEDGRGPDWPAALDPDVRRLPAFRTELRELLARASEHGLTPAALAALGRRTGRDAWVAAAAFAEEYLDVVAAARPDRLDPGELARHAVAAIDAGVGDRLRRLRLVVVDDLPDASESSLAVIAALARRGVAVIATGDPDVAANSFRGGEPDALGRLGALIGRPGIRSFVLRTAHRPVPEIRALTAAVTARIGAAAAGPQRQAVASRPAAWDPGRPPLARIEAPTAAREAAAIARVLREERVRHGVPWRELAVIVRSGADVPRLARALALAEVPTRSRAAGAAFREQPAARALLGVVDAAIGRDGITPETATALLAGPFGGLDPLALRRLRVDLRAEEVAGGGTRTAGELLAEALDAPGRLASIDSRAARLAARLAETVAAIRAAGPAATLEELLWIAWDRSGLAPRWRERALGGGAGAAEADRDLDAVVALFAAAKRLGEARPWEPAGVHLAALLDAEVPDDVLAPVADEDAVLVTTPAGAAGLEFATVVIARLQDGAWPNLRPRGSLLGVHRLPAAIRGEDAAIDERKLVLDDELRMFALAVSRARDRVVLSCVSSEDESRSLLFSLLPSAPDGEEPPLLPADAPPLTLRGMTARLRRTLTSPGVAPAVRADAASSLARLAELGVPGADPSEWHGLLPPSTDRPLFDDEPVPVSPSRLRRVEESPLDWFLETIGGRAPGVAASVGTILHAAMEAAGEGGFDELWAQVTARWPEIAFESPWLAERHLREARGFTEALAEYLADARAAGRALVAAEGGFELEVGQAVVSGTVDRLERDGHGGVTIVDLKTGRPITSQAAIDDEPQLGAYQLAYHAGAFDATLDPLGPHRPAGAKLLYVKSGKAGRRYREAEQAPLDEARLEAFRERIRAAATVMDAAAFEGVAEPPRYGATLPLRMHRVGAVSGD